MLEFRSWPKPRLVLEDGLPHKLEYRRFKVNGVDPTAWSGEIIFKSNPGEDAIGRGN